MLRSRVLQRMALKICKKEAQALEMYRASSFRTIQIWPKDLPGPVRQGERGVEPTDGARGGLENPPMKRRELLTSKKAPRNRHFLHHNCQTPFEFDTLDSSFVRGTVGGASV